MMATHAEKSGKNLEFWIQKSVQTLKREIELQMSLFNPSVFHVSCVECCSLGKIWTVLKIDMNKLLNKKVFLFFFFHCRGCLIQVLTLKKLQYVNLIFVNVIFFQ